MFYSSGALLGNDLKLFNELYDVPKSLPAMTP